MRPDALTALATHLSLLIGLSTTFALLLRGTRLPGGRPAAAIIGGSLAGFLLGSAVAARAWPSWHERVALGGRVERLELDWLLARHQADLTALRASGVTEVAATELAAEHRSELAAAEARLAAALASHQRSRDFSLAAMLAVALACAAWASARHPRRPTASSGSAELLAAVAAGIMATLLAALPVAVLLRWLTDLSVPAAISCGGAFAAGSLFAGMPMRWAPRLARTVELRVLALSASFAATVLLAWGLPPAAAAWILVPGAGMLGGAAFGRLFPPGAASRRAARAVVVVVVVPAVAAYAAQHVDWLVVWRDWRIALLLGLGVAVAGDGQFIGAWLGLQTFAPDRTRAHASALAMELVASGIGLTLAAMALLLLAAGVIDPAAREGQAVLALLLISAAATELTAPSGRRALRAATTLSTHHDA